MHTDRLTRPEDRGTHRRRHGVPWQPHQSPRRAGRGHRAAVVLVAGALALTPITAGLAQSAGASVTTESPAAARTTLAAAASPVTASGTTSAIDFRSSAPRATRSGRAAVRPSSSPYRFATKRFNRWYAKRYMAYRYRWYGAQFRCLAPLWGKESAWNARAHNSSSGAHGIPQAMPGSKMAKFGRGWRTNPVVQIKWGLAYIKGAYGTPCHAWSFWTHHHWY